MIRSRKSVLSSTNSIWRSLRQTDRTACFCSPRSISSTSVRCNGSPIDEAEFSPNPSFGSRFMGPRAAPKAATAQKLSVSKISHVTPEPAMHENVHEDERPVPTGIDFPAMIEELRSRPKHITRDRLSPMNSHLLNIALADILPPSCYPSEFSTKNLLLPPEEISKQVPLPQGHHLVYFPTQVTSSLLLEDGTDTLQFPGKPFTGRLWAGGSVLFKNSTRQYLRLDASPVSCVETISDINVRGQAGEEKVFIEISRRYGPESLESAKTLDEEGSKFGPATIMEKRNIVFLRAKSKTEKRAALYQGRRYLRAPTDSEFTVSFTPDPALLVRFSGLTHNAHLIHLDREYARVEEGYRERLVHGPLSLVLMLSVLRSKLKQGEMIRMFRYKNVAPIYVNEKVQVCLKVKKDEPHRYLVWIQQPDGNLLVTGQALIQTETEFERDDDSEPAEF